VRSGLLIAIAVSLVACGEDAATRRRRAEATVLARQNENLREIIAAAREKRLVDPRWLAVAVDEAAVKSVIEAGLPQEAVVAKRFRVRVESAEVSFRSGAGLVRLRAQVTDEESPDRRANVLYQGGLDDITVSPGGQLQTRVLIDHVEVADAQAAGSDARAITSVVDQLAGRNLEALQERVPPVAIPVRLQQNLAIDGLGDGPVQVDPGDLPVQVSVARVIPLSGRLWVLLDVKAGPWRPRASPAPPAVPSASATGS
jgi:hypothetical protein